jgi:hypothetical protein
VSELATPLFPEDHVRAHAAALFAPLPAVHRLLLRGALCIAVTSSFLDKAYADLAEEQQEAPAAGKAAEGKSAAAPDVAAYEAVPF